MMSADFKLEPSDDTDQTEAIFQTAYLKLSEKLTERHLISYLITRYMEINGLTKITCFKNDDDTTEIYFTNGVTISTNGKNPRSKK